MSVFKQIKTGLEEAIAYERGTLEAKVTRDCSHKTRYDKIKEWN